MGEFDLGCLRLQKKYRSHFEIIASIIKAAKDNGAPRFSLMKHASTNYAQLRKYLDPLVQLGFLEIVAGKNCLSYRASEKGLAFLQQYNILQDMLLSTHVNLVPKDGHPHVIIVKAAGALNAWKIER
jgi:predicted transcriptional regulator